MSEDIKDLKDAVERIERGLFGDREMGHAGIVAVQKDHGRRISKIERVGVYLAGASGLLSVLWAAWTQWPRK